MYSIIGKYTKPIEFMKEDGYLIYKATGGLAHNLYALLKAISIAKEKNYVLILDMENHEGFGVKFNDFFVINIPDLKYYEDYNFIPKYLKFKDISIDEIKKEKGKWKNGKYTFFGYNLSEEKFDDKLNIFAGVCGDEEIQKNIHYIKLNTDIVIKLENEDLIKNKYISVHFRNTDIKNDINRCIKKLEELIIQTKIKFIYWASDDNDSYYIVKKKIPYINIIRKTNPPSNVFNIHYNSKNKYKQVYDSIRDIFFILKSTYFIPSINSGYSKLIIRMINKKDYIIPNFVSNTKVVQ